MNNETNDNLVGRIDLGDDFFETTGNGSGRRANVAYRVYQRPVEKIPHQAKVLVVLINEAQGKNGKGYVTEPELEKILIEAKANGTLSTEQTAWRIFTYYRTRLIKDAKCLQQLNVSVE